MSSVSVSAKPGTVVLAVAITAVALVIAVQIYERIRLDQKYKFPGRIPGIPIFGNSFQIPAIQQGPWAKEKAEQYGEM